VSDGTQGPATNLLRSLVQLRGTLLAVAQTRVDRMVETVRSLAPVIAVGGVVVMFALGPRRVLGLVRRDFTIALYANQARYALLG